MSEKMIVFLISVFTIASMAVVQCFYPNFSSKNLVLGVVIPEELVDSEELKDFIRSYRFSTMVLAAILLIPGYLLLSMNTMWMGLIIVWLLVSIFLLFIPVIFYNRKITNWKKASGYRILVSKRVVDIGLSKDKTTYRKVPLWLYIFPLLVVVAGTVYILVNYDAFPSSIPMHYDYSGAVDSYMEKSLYIVLTPTLTNALMLGILFFSNLMLLKSKQKLDSEAPDESLDRLLKARRIWTMALAAITMVLVSCMQLIMTWSMLGNWKNLGGMQILLYILPVVILIIITVLGFRVGNIGEKLQRSQYKLSKLEDDDRHWYFGGSIYYNPEDPAVIVPKRIGIGSTVNAATTIGKLMYLGLVVVILISLVGLLKIK